MHAFQGFYFVLVLVGYWLSAVFDVPQVWYFVAADCNNRTIDLKTGEQKEVTISIMATDNGSQFSYEEQGMFTFYITAGVIFVGILGTNLLAFWHDLKENGV